MSEHTDDALIRRMADGDEAALGALYDLWAERVHTLAFWMLKDEDEAEDVVEETFWQCWRTAKRYDSRRAAGATWLMMIARSRALDRLRGRRRRADWTAADTTVSALQDQAAAANADASIGRPELTEERAELASALQALPAEQRQAVELAFISGLSHAEIAAHTAQPLGTIKTRIRLAMQKLRERLAFLREEGP